MDFKNAEITGDPMFEFDAASRYWNGLIVEYCFLTCPGRCFSRLWTTLRFFIITRDGKDPFVLEPISGTMPVFLGTAPFSHVTWVKYYLPNV